MSDDRFMLGTRSPNFAGFEFVVDHTSGVATIIASTGEEFSFQCDGPAAAKVVIHNFINRVGMDEALAELLVTDVDWPDEDIQ